MCGACTQFWAKHPMDILDWWKSFVFGGGKVAGSLIDIRVITTICSSGALIAVLRQYWLGCGVLSMVAMSVVWVNVCAFLCFVLVILTKGSSEGAGLLFLPVILAFAYTPLGLVIGLLAALFLAPMRMRVSSEARECTNRVARAEKAIRSADES